MGEGTFGGVYGSSASAQASAIVEAARNEAGWRVAKAVMDVAIQDQLSKYQVDLANWQIDMANEIQQHWEKFLPYEKQLLAYAFSVPEVVANYNSIMQAWGDLVEDSFGANYDEYIQWCETNCVTPTACTDAQWQNELSLATADYASYAARTEEQRTEALNDVRYAMQKATLAMGKGIALSLVSFSQAAGRTANGMGTLAGLVNYGMQQFGLGRPMTLPNQQPGVAPMAHDMNIPVSVQPEKNKVLPNAPNNAPAPLERRMSGYR